MKTGERILNESNKPIMVQRLVCRVCPHLVHNLIIQPPENGGFDGAQDSDGNVLILERSFKENGQTGLFL